MIHGKRSGQTSRRLVQTTRAAEEPVPQPQLAVGSGFTGDELELSGSIYEAQVVWDPDGGHNHDGTVSREITLTGDASGTNLATTVTKLFNLTIATPAAGDDAQFLRYNHATGYSWETAISAITVQEGDSTVDAAVTTLDFAAADFNVTSSPAGEANISWQGFTVEEGNVSVATDIKDLDFASADFNVTASGGEAEISWQGFTVEVSNVSVATDIKDLDFGSGFDVTASGGEAEISIDLSEIVTGDVTFSTNAATVAKIQGFAVAAPVAGDDLQFLRYNHTGTTYSWEQVTFTGLSGSISATQHGTLAVGSGADHTGDLSATAKVNVNKNGTLVGTQRTIDFIEGTNITLTVTDSGGEINVTIDAAAGGGSTIVVQEGDATVDAAAGTLDFAAGDFNVTSSPAGEANISWQGFTVEEANVSVATDIKDLDFGAGFDITASGGEAEIGLDLSEVVTGDISFSTNVATVNKIRNVTLTSPVGGQTDWMALTFEGTTYVHAFRTVAYSLWRRSDISAAGAAFAEMPMFEGVNCGKRMPAAGYILGVEVTCSADIGTAGDDYSVEVYKATSDGGAYSATGVTVTITGGAGTERSASTIATDVSSAPTFNAGDILTIYDKETGSLAAVSTNAALFVTFEV